MELQIRFGIFLNDTTSVLDDGIEEYTKYVTYVIT